MTTLRVSFACELGWEIHASVEHIAEIYAAVTAAGATPYGMYALNALRLKKGYRSWKGDLSSEYSVLQAGPGRFIKWAKPAFEGKAASVSDRK